MKTPESNIRDEHDLSSALPAPLVAQALEKTQIAKYQFKIPDKM